MLKYEEFKKTIPENKRFDGNHVARAWTDYFRENAEAGDGATVCWWSDQKAYTIIKRSEKTLTLQRDKATLVPEFKPEFVIGGFSAHCINQHEQSYTYERDDNGEIIKAYWSEKKHGFYWNGMRVISGRHEFYDYNF